MASNLPLVYHPHYSIAWPADHRFPMSKFKLLYDYLLAEKIAAEHQFHEPRPVSLTSLHAVHDAQYIQHFCHGTWDAKIQRRIGLNWYPELVERSFAEVGGTIRTVQLALEHGLACNTAGGTHHAYPDFGSGFCILNDLAVAAKVALEQRWAKKIVIVDLDVHQGDGTAFIFAQEPRVFTFSMHAARNFPFRKQQSNCDIGLDDNCDDEAYLARLAENLPAILDREQPDLVLYDAGADVHKEDRLGKLRLSDDGILARDYYVLDQCKQRVIPTACVIGGGYAEHKPDLAPRHALLHRAADQIWRE